LNEAIAMTDDARPPARRGSARFVPPILWMGLIGLGSSSLLSGSRTGHWMYSLFGQLGAWTTPALLEAIHLGIRKLGHLLEFGVLAVLWYRALAPAPRATAAALLLATAYGAVDELRQGLDPSRVPAVTDVVVDGLGAGIALAAWAESRALRAATLRVAAWVVGALAALGALATVLDLSLGRPAGDVAGAALGLGLLAAGLARWAQGARRPAAPPPGRPAEDAAGRP
jgi:VanZ family protein